MLSPPPLISMLVFISCLALMRISIRFVHSNPAFFVSNSHSVLTVTCTRHWIVSLVNVSLGLLLQVAVRSPNGCPPQLEYVSSSRILDWMRHRKRYRRARPPCLCSQFERYLFSCQCLNQWRCLFWWIPANGRFIFNVNVHLHCACVYFLNVSWENRIDWILKFGEKVKWRFEAYENRHCYDASFKLQRNLVTFNSEPKVIR